MNLLHLITEREWRGGENQVLQFIKLSKKDSDQRIHNFLALYKNSESAKIFKEKLIYLSPFFLLNLFKLIRLIKKNKIQSIICHSSKAHTLGVFIKLFSPQVRLVVFKKTNRVPSNKWKYTTKLIDAYIAVSYAVKNSLKKSGVSENRIYVVRDFIEPSQMNPNSLLNFKKKIFHFMNLFKKPTIISSVGFLDEQKNHALLIKAASLLKNKKDNFICFIAGKGPLKNTLQKMIEDLDLSSHVILLDFIKEIPELLNLSDIFVLPSNNEALGSVLIEAALNNCILVGTNDGGIPELISDDQDGFLFTPNSAEELCSCLEKILDDLPIHQKKFLKKSRAKIKTNFCAKKSYEKLKEIYFL